MKEVINGVAKRTGLAGNIIQRILYEAFDEISENLIKGKEVLFPHFGRFYTVNGRYARYAAFRASPHLAHRITQKGTAEQRRPPIMEKYGVELDDEKTKTAEKGAKCPKCGAELTDPAHCPNCGTEPFEKKERNQTMRQAYAKLYGKQE